jgi:Zn-dependent protease
VSSGLPAGRIAGVPLRIGPSWLVIAPVVGLALFAGVSPSLGAFWPRAATAAGGALMVLASVVVHEVGHVVIARRHRVPVRQMAVFLLGGYSDMDLDEEPPPVQMSISAAGPIASVVFAGLISLSTMVLPESAGLWRTARVLVLVNGAIAVFNLLPAYPLDGGRISVALLREGGWPRARAERFVANAAVALGVAGATLGVVAATQHSIGSILLWPSGVLLVGLGVASRPRVPRAGEVMRPFRSVLGETDPVGESVPAVVVSGERVVGVIVALGQTGGLAAEVMIAVEPADLVGRSERLAGAALRRLEAGRPLVVVDEGIVRGLILRGSAQPAAPPTR